MIALYLVSAHLLADFILQPHWMAVEKLTDWKVRLAHVYIHTIVMFLILFLSNLTWNQRFYFLLFYGSAHFIIDSRRWCSGLQWPPKPIVVDQCLHIITLAFLGALFNL